MYETFFGLTRRPFTAAPQVEQYVPNHYSEQALQTLSRTIERGEGPALVIGATGVGKTFLLQMLAERYVKQFRVAYLASARFSSPRALLQNILFELGRPYRGMDEEELRLALTEFVSEHDSDDRPLLLLVDEAHTLSLRLLEEIRLITNLVRGGQPLVRLVLAGNARLEERFTNPKLDSLNQRIAARCYLESLNREDTAYYVRQQIEQAGGNSKKLLADDAFGAIYTATDGVPRLLNQVCDQALILAAVAGRRALDAACVEEAWADLQQLPTPWNRDPISRSATPAAESGVIEFGSLSDEPAAAKPPAATPTKEAPAAAATPAKSHDDEAVFTYDTHLANDPVLEIEQLHHSIGELAEEVHSHATQTQPAFDPSEPAEASSYDDEEFLPAGFVGPEVELIFHAPHNPFGETFAEEEVVIDHFASLEKTATDRLVHDQSGQSSEIAAVLAKQSAAEAAKQEPAAPALSIVAAEHDEDLADEQLVANPAYVKQPPATDLPTITAQWEAAAQEPVLPSYHDDLSLFESLARLEKAAPGEEQERFNDHLSGTGDDRDIIIVEDDRSGGAALATQPASRVRRQEYRQLFARLRRGG